MKGNVAEVKKVLEVCGPLTALEVLSYFEEDTQQNIAAILSRLRIQTHKAVYIEKWEQLESSTGTRWSAVYALGNKRDAKRPTNLSVAERSKRYRDKRSVPKVPNSVWQLALYV